MKVVLHHSAEKYLMRLNADDQNRIEPASPAECKKIEKRVKEYYEDPSSFISWSEVKKKLKAKDSKKIKA